MADRTVRPWMRRSVRSRTAEPVLLRLCRLQVPTGRRRRADRTACGLEIPTKDLHGCAYSMDLPATLVARGSELPRSQQSATDLGHVYATLPPHVCRCRPDDRLGTACHYLQPCRSDYLTPDRARTIAWFSGSLGNHCRSRRSRWNAARSHVPKRTAM